MKILILDNYDSFTYNLVHIIRELNYNFDVYRNDKITLEEVDKYDKILLSPGPGIPSEAGIMQALIKTYAPTKSILGICLGHQGIAEVFGATLFNIPEVLHGVTSQTTVLDKNEVLYHGLPSTFQVCHYHSWAVSPESITPDLIVTAKNSEGMIMGIRHKQYNVRGLQFHPESIMTPEGPKIMKNWLEN
ncbi:MAG: aminodeoxychorismate/anthranilate synthase component II [Cyclobacteriaceae bacterium]|nr:aminodeoxychorismate/anthranilate synthase component II [Cyclobacteriaceae bacterium]